MSTAKRLSQVLKQSPVIPIKPDSKFVIMSDCHRGDGSWSDNFLKNQNLFFAALNYYYELGYTYIELGDGDELWENRNLNQIISIHSDAYWLMSRFYEDRRLYLLYGNHDQIKKEPRYVDRFYRSYYCDGANCHVPLFPGISIGEGLILKDAAAGQQILLTHGHQGDLLNDTLWKMTRSLVRYCWKPLELLGFLDPTSAAKNYRKKKKVERRLIEWAKKENQMLICGHTHRPHFPGKNEPPYFNDGSCVHPRCITAIEIAGGSICLVKWTILTDEDRRLFVGREILAGPAPLWDYLGHTILS